MQDIFEYVQAHGETEASTYFNVSQKSMARYLQLYRKTYGVGKIEEKENGDIKVVIPSVANSLMNYEEVMKLADIDPDKYTTHRIDYNVKADGSTQSKFAFVPRKDPVETSPEEYVERFKSMLVGYEPPKVPVYKSVDSDLLVTVSAFDIHHGKQVWARESGTDDYDIHISKDNFMSYISYVVSMLEKYPAKTVLLEVGGDFFNSNSPANETIKGTAQSEDSRYIKTEEYAEQFVTWSIDLLAQHCENVHVLFLPGNHDADRLMVFSHFIDAWYRNNDRVTIDSRPLWHKTYVFGDTYLMYTHQMLPNIVPLMASLEPKAFAESHTRICNIGHLHTRKDTIISRDTNGGIEIVQHPSMIPGDAWSVSAGYQSVRKGLIRVFDKAMGKIAEINYEPRWFQKGDKI